MTGLVAVVMIFSIPIIGIITEHFQKQSKIKNSMIKEQLELEKLRHENFLLETEKMKLELDQMKQENSKNDIKLL